LRECFNPAHPLSRSDDKKWKSAQLAYLSQDLGLVTGTETGMDWGVPFVHYFEGMMSLGHFRLPDSGYDLFTYIQPQEDFWRFQVGPYYRVPLFELVYHDCVVATWYWGDSCNRIPEAWAARDLFNALYGTPPLWAMGEDDWKNHRDRFVASYGRSTETARCTAFSEMTGHQFATEDHTVQCSSFADGTRVWANFGKKDFLLENGTPLKPGNIIIYNDFRGQEQPQFLK
jgi:hypothetical protein